MPKARQRKACSQRGRSRRVWPSFCPRLPCSATQWGCNSRNATLRSSKASAGPPAFQQWGEAPRTGKSTLGQYLQGVLRIIKGEPPRSAHSRPRFLGRARGREQFASASWGVDGRSVRRTLLLARYRRQKQPRRCNSSRYGCLVLLKAGRVFHGGVDFGQTPEPLTPSRRLFDGRGQL